jgi:hypothetical protein
VGEPGLGGGKDRGGQWPLDFNNWPLDFNFDPRVDCSEKKTREIQ